LKVFPFGRCKVAWSTNGRPITYSFDPGTPPANDIYKYNENGYYTAAGYVDKPYDEDVTLFNNGGVPWKNASVVYTYSHAKYLIIDRTTAVIMSMNFNTDAMNRERNYGVVDRDPEDVTDVQAIFDQDWALAKAIACSKLSVSVNVTGRQGCGPRGRLFSVCPSTLQRVFAMGTISS